MTDPGYYSTTSFKAHWLAGETAWLRWNGFQQVPRYMSDWQVTVLRCTRSGPATVPLYRVRVEQDGSERTVRADQLEVPH